MIGTKKLIELDIKVPTILHIARSFSKISLLFSSMSTFSCAVERSERNSQKGIDDLAASKASAFSLVEYLKAGFSLKRVGSLDDHFG